jgi:DNA recombination protein Rad52
MSGFTGEQINLLRAPLGRDHVKSRRQAGRNLSYIEGWVAIAEANRIFGFDGWDRETTDCKCISERETMMGENRDRPGWRVGYVGRVRVTVRAGDAVIVREGTGYGSGIDADPGQAHESAIKECETDSLKRALMTFGNQFGLALYDKEQSEVEPVARPQQRPPAGRAASQQPPATPFDEPPAPNGHDDAEREASRDDMRTLMAAFKAAPNEDAIDDPQIGLWAVSKAKVERIRTYGGASAMAMLNKAAQDRIDQLRGDKFEV